MKNKSGTFINFISTYDTTLTHKLGGIQYGEAMFEKWLDIKEKRRVLPSTLLCSCVPSGFP